MTIPSDIDALILAGGRGTRLYPVLGDLPKFLAPIGGRPFADYIFEQLESFGIQRVVLALGHLNQVVASYVESRVSTRLDIRTSVESNPLGTAGALRLAHSLLRSRTVLVLNGDSYVEIEFPRLLGLHEERGAAATLAAVRVPDASRYGRIDLDPEGKVTRFREKVESRGEGWINAGMYLFRDSVLESIPSGPFVSLEQDILPRLCDRGLYALECDGEFLDIGTPFSLSQAELFFRELRKQR